MEKGTTNNPNGRPKGAKNKVGSEVREAIAKFVTEKLQPDEMNDLWCDLEAHNRAKLITELMKYVVAPATPEDGKAEEESGRSFYDYLNRAAKEKKVEKEAA